MAIASWRITLSDSFHHPTVKDKVHAFVQGIFLSICIISMRINFSVPFRAENRSVCFGSLEPRRRGYPLWVTSPRPMRISPMWSSRVGCSPCSLLARARAGCSRCSRGEG
jgi:hypothetical protein